jgi:periplasmic protein TonB
MKIIALIGIIFFTATTYATEVATSFDTPPVPIKRTTPDYPSDMKKKRISGEVQLSFIVETDGSVREAEVRTTTDEKFNKAAVNAVKKWQFKPGTKDGKAVRCRVVLPIMFSIAKE